MLMDHFQMTKNKIGLFYLKALVNAINLQCIFVLQNLQLVDIKLRH